MPEEEKNGSGLFISFLYLVESFVHFSFLAVSLISSEPFAAIFYSTYFLVTARESLVVAKRPWRGHLVPANMGREGRELVTNFPSLLFPWPVFLSLRGKAWYSIPMYAVFHMTDIMFWLNHIYLKNDLLSYDLATSYRPLWYIWYTIQLGCW